MKDKLKKIGTAIMGMLSVGTIALADTATGAAGFAAALQDSTTGITSANLWTEVTAFSGLICAIFIFAFGFKRVKKLLGGGVNAKVKI